jgi:hypothetical protein
MLPFQILADTVRNTTKEPRSVTTQYAAINEAAQLHPALSNSREVSANVVTQDIGDGAYSGKKRCKQ